MNWWVIADMTGIQRLESAPIVISARRIPVLHHTSYTGGDTDIYNNNTRLFTTNNNRYHQHEYTQNHSSQYNAHLYTNSLSNLIGNAALDNQTAHVYDNINEISRRSSASATTTPIKSVEQRQRARFVRADSESRAYDANRTTNGVRTNRKFVRRNSLGYRKNLTDNSIILNSSADSTFDSGHCSDFNSNGIYCNDDYGCISGRSDVNGTMPDITTTTDPCDNTRQDNPNYLRTSCTTRHGIGVETLKAGASLPERRPVLGTGALTSPSRMRPNSAGVVLRSKKVNSNGVVSPAQIRPTSACDQIMSKPGHLRVVLRNGEANEGHVSSAENSPIRTRPISVCEQVNARNSQGVPLRRREMSTDRVYRLSSCDCSRDSPAPQRPISTCEERFRGTSPIHLLPSPRERTEEGTPCCAGTPPPGRSKESPVRELIRRISLHVKRKKTRSGEKERPRKYITNKTRLSIGINLVDDRHSFRDEHSILCVSREGIDSFRDEHSILCVNREGVVIDLEMNIVFCVLAGRG